MKAVATYQKFRRSGHSADVFSGIDRGMLIRGRKNMSDLDDGGGIALHRPAVDVPLERSSEGGR